MSDVGATKRPHYARCDVCGRIYDAAVASLCPTCARAGGPPDVETARPASGSTAESGSRSRTALWLAAAFACVALPAAISTVWLAGSGGRLPPSPGKAEEDVMRPPDTQERRPGASAQERPLNLPPGATFKECEACPEMVVVPGGSFVMGSPETEYGHADSEQPQHIVRLPGNFGAGKFEVTVRQFVEFLNAAVKEGRSAERWVTTTTQDDKASVVRTIDGGTVRFSPRAEHEDLPMTFVSWGGAVEYARWLSSRTGTTYRLLSEAEWEYAARAGSSTAYHFGDDPTMLCEFANVADLSGQARHRWSPVVDCEDGHAELAPVGSFQPNAFGLYDMIGNAAEWVADCWHRSYDGAPNDGSAWVGQSDCSGRAVRGGSYHYLPAGLRSAKRYANAPSTKFGTIGFRVARSIPP